MTCKEEVVRAFESLTKDSGGRLEFTPAEVLARVKALGTSYATSTVRTHVTAHMVEDGTLVRTGPGRYRLRRHLGRDQLSDARAMVPPSPVTIREVEARITEDAVKEAVAMSLRAEGWSVDVRWGRERGVDIDATRGHERLIIEAKGEAPPGPQQVNYFLNALGELVQRVSDPNAVYALALPDHPQYRGLWSRLPSLARERLRLIAIFVDRDGRITRA